MNRIYQGRASSVELLAEKANKGTETVIRKYTQDESNQVLWDFHHLFQDAVNYYLVCLMALATEPNNPITPIRERADSEDTAHNIWRPFRRKGQTRQGMREVAKYFGLKPNETSLSDCCNAAIAGNNAAPELLDLALQELLYYCDGDGKIQQEGRSMFPRFCVSDYKASYNTGASANLRDYGKDRLSDDLHQIHTETELKKFANEIEVGWVANISKKGALQRGEQSRARLLKAVAHFGQCFGTHSAGTKLGDRARDFLKSNPSYEALLLSIEEQINNTPLEELPHIPPNTKSTPDRLDACLLLKYFPQLPLADLVKISFPYKKKKEKGKSRFEYNGEDAIKQARSNRGYIFPAFTSLPCFDGKKAKPQWREFDIAAFKEALKTLHQVKQKRCERQNKRKKLKKRFDYMTKGEGDFRAELQDEGFERPPLTKGDPRIERIEAILQSLGGASDLAEEGFSRYGMTPRTIRGFEQLIEKWHRLEVDKCPEKEALGRLEQALNKLQCEHCETFGSIALFKELMKPDNWIVWQNAGDRVPAAYQEKGFALNPLAAYVQQLSLEEEISRLNEPIRFTPADPRYSRRLYPFGDKNTFKHLKGQYHHEQTDLAVVVGIAVCVDGVWQKQRARLRYTAPRLLRDGLRTLGAEINLQAMPWLQPMMAALEGEKVFPQEMHNIPVFLMPKRGRNDEIIVHLNFPVTLDEARIARMLGERTRWKKQFAGGIGTLIYLRWPEDEWPEGTRQENAWFTSPEPFRVLSVDLGIRDAGAMALLECRPDTRFKKTKQNKARHYRRIGETNDTTWYASVIKTKMLRLPGEDVKVWRKGALKQELSGEKGRLAREWETNEALEVLKKLGYKTLMDQPPFHSDSPSTHRFFAQQNHLLLLALRWAQGRLRAWQSASWRLEAAPEKAKEMLETDQNLPLKLSTFVKNENWPKVKRHLEDGIATLKASLCENLAIIANRVAPLRGRQWEWVERDDKNGYILRQTTRGTDNSKTWIAGQRGLSIERIEQIEELRKRCQSLNKALQHTPGTKPQLGFRSKGQDASDPCPDILEKLEHIREQRVNQTAHLILAEALGVQLKTHTKNKAERRAKDIHGEYQKVREPVDFIVLEDLNRYLTSQGRSRMENSRLMKWSHRAILAKLKQLCETYGIPVLESAAAYSSRFSAKDGVAGFRAMEVTWAHRHKYPWKKMLAKNHVETVQLFKQLEEISKQPPHKVPRKLLAPIAGGPIFIPMKGSETQADINAAINLGLRAIAAPDALDIHHRIRTERDKRGDLKPLTHSKREKARWGKEPAAFDFNGNSNPTRNSNCFPLLGFDVDYEKCTMGRRVFATGKGLWGTIKAKQWARVHELNTKRIRKNGWEDNIPF